MNREIKFRGKTLNTGKWVYGNLVTSEDKNNCFIVGEMVEANDEYCNLEMWEPVREETIGQYTGLKDMHGKEIYDGDILSWNRLYLLVRLNSDDSYIFTIGQYQLNKSCAIYSEIVGNKFDNQNLMDSKKLI